MYKIIACFFGTMLLYGSANAFCEYLEQKQERGVPFALMFGMGLGVMHQELEIKLVLVKMNY